MELLNYPGYRYCYYVLKYFLQCRYFPKMISLKYHEPYYHYVHFLHCYYKKSCYVYYLDEYMWYSGEKNLNCYQFLLSYL